jgi:L-lactate utilization protein LutB
MATAAILNFYNPPKAATHYGGYSYKVSSSLMKGIQKMFKSPLFCFHGNCGKVCPTDSDFFVLYRSTRCGCCSYHVSSISVWRVTCYDHFCVFQFFSILAISMAMAAILKKSTLKSTTSHGI